MTAKFTPEDVRKAYIEKKLTPSRGRFGVSIGAGYFIKDSYSDGCACAIGAMLIDTPVSTRDPGDGDRVLLEADERLGINSIWAFTRGFDGVNDPTAVNDPYFQLGRACWEAVKDLVPGREKEKQS